ncbi:hypothetical protein V500_11447 [Pseudogymnoascus sp. VKM F-4518 (FW-2643)]|nr:hypothetical protein V500_11447 [Pseudogymnoascus sp. VKM F-4518 (FW-2643)]
MRVLLSFLILGLLGIASALSTSGNRLLVVLEELAEKDKYSKFFGDLKGRGFDITFESPKSDSLALFQLGERAYDHLLILPSKSKGLGPNLTPQTLLKFINTEGNILLTLSASNPTPSALVSLLLELDIHLPTDRNSIVVDHFNYDSLSAAESHDVILVPRPSAVRPGVRNFFGGVLKNEVIAFPHGVGQTLGNDSPYLTPILRAPGTAYSYNPKEEAEAVEDPFAVGQQLSLVTAVQARNSARFTVLGSAEMFEDKWFKGKVQVAGGKVAAAANDAFAKEISGWTFNEIGVLKVESVTHFLNEEGLKTPNASLTNPKIYRVKNTVTYSIELSEWSWNEYVPFVPATEDEVQLEFSMLSPFHRLSLERTSTNPSSSIFSTTFKLPDQHGIFNFLVEFRRPFLSNIEDKTTVTVRHFAHDEWPRSWVISAAWPWISGVAVTVVGWIIFVGLWLYSAPPAVKVTTGKKAQ